MVRLVHVDDPREVAEYLMLELLASEPYTRFVYDNGDVAREAHRYLFSQELSEFGPEFGRVLTIGTRVAGMASWLTATELRRSRLDAGVALARGGFLNDGSGPRRRTTLAAATLLEPASEDLYLSRLAVARAERNQGVGAQLLKEYEAEAGRRGCTRLVLEINPDNETAAHLCRGVGFEELDRRVAHDPETGRELHYLHLAKPVSET